MFFVHVRNEKCIRSNSRETIIIMQTVINRTTNNYFHIAKVIYFYRACSRVGGYTLACAILPIRISFRQLNYRVVIFPTARRCRVPEIIELETRRGYMEYHLKLKIKRILYRNGKYCFRV